MVQIGMVGLGRMGANMVKRLLAAGHECVAHDLQRHAVEAAVASGALGAETLAELVATLRAPRVIWLMLPAAVVDPTIDALLPRLQPGDTVIDGGNSHYRHDFRRAATLAGRGLHYVDVGTSGGVWGLVNGYCLMVGGEGSAVARLEEVFDALAPLPATTLSTTEPSERGASAERGWLHCGGSGAGHFVKMVHNGIEYGMMAAYAEGFEILRSAGIDHQPPPGPDQTVPLSQTSSDRYAFDIAAIAELWRRGSVVRSWLLDLAAEALFEDPTLDGLSSRVADSGEGRWALEAAIELGAPTPVLASALFARFTSQGRGEFGNRIVAAMRRGFGGHQEAGHDH